MKAQRKPFERGDEVLVKVHAGTNGYTEQNATVKEMTGKGAVAVQIGGRDRIVWLTDVRPKEKQAIQAPERPVPSPIAKISDLPTANKLEAPRHFTAKPTPAEAPATIGQLMLKERTEKGMTAELMARMLRIEKPALAQFESGEDIPGDDVVLRFADVLDVPLELLLSGVETAKRVKVADAERAAAAENADQHRAVRRQVELAQEMAAILWNCSPHIVSVVFQYQVGGQWIAKASHVAEPLSAIQSAPDFKPGDAAAKLITVLATALEHEAKRLESHLTKIKCFKLPESCQVTGGSK